ncbi:MAG: repeat protein [Planctomycetaceae bacterium]|nr:repeat protein [Planctomycetaceae bacterium]
MKQSSLNSFRSGCIARSAVSALLWGAGLIVPGCSEKVPVLPSQAAKIGLDSKIEPTESHRKPVPPVERISTKVLFENWAKEPVFRFENGGEHPQRSILETLGGGIAAVDFDRDGWPDLCFAAGGKFVREDAALSLQGVPISLFRYRGEQGAGWDPVSREAGITEHELFSLGVAAADFNNDGFLDLCATGYGPLRLYQNQGDGTFLECASGMTLQDHDFSTGAAWCDLNADGALDLYVCHYVVWNLEAERACLKGKASPTDICGPKSFLSASDRVFLGQGDGTFRDGTAESGLQPGGKGLGVVAGDVDRDGDVDLYVANDTTANFLYLNDGHGRLEEVGALNGVAYDENGRATGSMGVALADYDNDGLPDLWTTNFEQETLGLFRNMERAQFHMVSRQAGVTVINGEYVSWGTAFADFDFDGDLDVVVSNGHIPDYVPQDRLAQQPFLLINDGHRRFELAGFPSGNYFNSVHTGRGLAVVDIDRDGRLDVVVSHLSEPASVLRNMTNVSGTLLEVTLVGRDSNRDGWGTTAILETSIGLRLRQLTGGGSYLSTSEPVLRWELPPETALKKLTLYWPSGKVQVIEHFRNPVTKPKEATAISRMQLIEP